MKKKITPQIFTLLALCLIHSHAGAQLKKELAGIDYVFIGQGKTTNNDPISFSKWEFRFSIPKRMKKKGSFLMNSFKYARLKIGYGEHLSIMNTELENFHSISYSLGYSMPLNRGWRFTAILSPQISSNFEGNFNLESINLFGIALLTKPLGTSKRFILTLGAMYSATTGIPAPLPFASLLWRATPKLRINIGFPRINITYQLSKGSSLGTNLIITGENLTLGKDLNYKTDQSINTSTDINNIRISNMAMGLFYRQKIWKMAHFNINAGHTFRRIYEFRENNTSKKNFNLSDNVYLKAGFSLGL